MWEEVKLLREDSQRVWMILHDHSRQLARLGDLLGALAESMYARSVEELVLDLLAGEVDPRERVRAYLSLHKKYLKEAEELYVRGDLLQAGEKY